MIQPVQKNQEASQDFTAPFDACNTFKLAYKRLSEFKEDLHAHSFGEQPTFSKSPSTSDTSDG